MNRFTIGQQVAVYHQGTRWSDARILLVEADRVIDDHNRLYDGEGHGQDDVTQDLLIVDSALADLQDKFIAQGYPPGIAYELALRNSVSTTH